MPDSNNDQTPETAPIQENTFKHKIGNTTYTVNVYFNPNSSETLSDKLLRLMKNDLMQGKF